MPTESVRPQADVVPRWAIRDPDQWLGVAAWGVVAFSCLQILLFSFGRDQGIYAVVADAILNGQMPYRDAWDFKPPGIFLVFTLAQALFGKSMLAIRLLEVAGLVGAVLGLQRLGQVFFERPKAGLVAGAVAALIHAELEFWHTAQPETFGGFFTIGALVLLTWEPNDRKRLWAMAGVGALFGLCFLLKPPLGGGLLVCAAYALTREQTRGGSRRRLLLTGLALAAGCAAPLLLVFGWLLAGGAWPAFHWTFADFVPGYTKLNWSGARAPEMLYYALEEAFFKFSALSAAGVISAVAIAPMHSREREGIFLVLGIVAIQIAGVAMQGKFFPYHYGATLLLNSFIAGLGLYKLFRRCLAAGAGGVLAYASFLIVAVSMRDAVRDLPQGFWERSALRMSFLLRLGEHESRADLDRDLSYVADYNLAADREVAYEIRSHTRSDDPVFVWGFEPAIYYLSERPLASRYTYNVPQRSPWQREQTRRELLGELAARRPAIIVVQRYDVFPAVTGNAIDSRDELGNFHELSRLLDAQYRKLRQIEDFDVYERIGNEPGPG